MVVAYACSVLAAAIVVAICLLLSPGDEEGS